MSSKRAAVLLADGFEEIEAVVPIDLLRRGGIDVAVVGIARKEVTGSHGVTVSADVLLENLDYRSFDAVILPGGMPGSKNLAESPGVQKMVLNMDAEGKLVAAICAAPAVVLGPLGILDGKKASCYPGMESHAPNAEFTDAPVTADGNVITAQGPGKSAQFALAVLEYLAGADVSLEVGTKSLFIS